MAEPLERFGVRFDAEISIEISDEAIMERLAGCRVCGRCGASYRLTAVPPKREGVCDLCGAALVRRKDDAPQTVKERLAVYHRETAPLQTSMRMDPSIFQKYRFTCKNRNSCGRGKRFSLISYTGSGIIS